MDMTSGAVVTFSLQQVNDEMSSLDLEPTGCYEALTELKHHRMEIYVFGTDSSPSVATLIRTLFPDILHERDVYHVEKRIKKELLKNAHQRGNHALYAWLKPVLNQLWWAAQNCNKTSTELREKWISTIYHITDKHKWDHFELYKECAHDELTVDERKKKNG